MLPRDVIGLLEKHFDVPFFHCLRESYRGAVRPQLDLPHESLEEGRTTEVDAFLDRGVPRQLGERTNHAARLACERGGLPLACRRPLAEHQR